MYHNKYSHLTWNELLHYVMKYEDSKIVVIMTAYTINYWYCCVPVFNNILLSVVCCNIYLFSLLSPYWKIQNNPAYATVTTKKTRNILDCDQSYYSSRIILSHIPAKLLSRSWIIKRIHLKFSKMTWGRLLDLVQPEVDPYNTPTPKTTLVPNMWISKMAVAAILDFFEPEIVPLDPPSPKTLP